MEVDEEKIDEAALALLYLTIHDKEIKGQALIKN